MSYGTHVIIETVTDFRSHKIVREVPEKGLRIHIEDDGHIKVLKHENQCKVCNGGGGRCYHYAQDESKVVDCPTCNDGDQERWDAEDRRWNEHQRN